ncbi:MAG: PAS domain S-box protein [Thermodesulfobacteriota bacterium]
MGKNRQFESLRAIALEGLISQNQTSLLSTSIPINPFDLGIINWVYSQFHMGLIVTDKNLNIQRWSRWLEYRSGKTSAELSGKNIFEIFPELVNRAHHLHFKEALLGHVRILAYAFHKYLIRLKPTKVGIDFDFMPQSAVIGPLFVQNELLGTLAIIEDVSDRLLREQELIREIRSKEDIIRQLESEKLKVKTLSGMLPICSSCKKIRDDKGYWNHVEYYISKHTDVDFSHSICPDCMRKLYPEYAEEVLKE